MRCCLSQALIGSDSHQIHPCSFKAFFSRARHQYSPIQCCSYACYLRAASSKGALVAGIAADAANVPWPPLQQSNRLSNGVHKLAALDAICKALYSMLRKTVCTFEACLQFQESTMHCVCRPDTGMYISQVEQGA